MKQSKLLLSIFMLTIFLFSCESNQIEEKNNIDINKYINLRNAISNDLNKIGSEIRANGLNFSDANSIKKIGAAYFANDNYNLNHFNTYFSLSGISSSARISDPSLEGEEIVNNANQYSSLEDYLNYLDTQFTSIAYSSMSTEDKEYLLTFLAAYQAGLIYIDGNLDIVAPGDIATQGWWDSWGKCAAGVLGGAGLGAMAGATYGGVGCTVVLPVVGTVACGTVGAVAGAVFGGLAGASQSC